MVIHMSDDNTQPTLTVIIKEERVLPEGTSEQEAIDAAKQSFARELEAADENENRSIEFQYTPPDTKEPTNSPEKDNN